MDTADPPHPTIWIGFNLDRPDARKKLAALEPSVDYDDVRCDSQTECAAKSGDDCLTQKKQVWTLYEVVYLEMVEYARRGYKEKTGGDIDTLCCAIRNLLIDMTFNLGPCAGQSRSHDLWVPTRPESPFHLACLSL